MALLPYRLRPAVMIRRKAMYSGFLGRSSFWKIVGVAVFGRRTLKKFFGKNVEVLEVSKLGVGRYMQVTTSKPMSRRSRKKMVRAGQTPPTRKSERALAKKWVNSQSRAS